MDICLYKIRVTPLSSRVLQNKLFATGLFCWHDGTRRASYTMKPYLYIYNNGEILYGEQEYTFRKTEGKEIDLTIYDEEI